MYCIRQQAMTMTRTVDIYLFDEIEALDLGEPFEGFSVGFTHGGSADAARAKPFEVFTVAGVHGSKQCSLIRFQIDPLPRSRGFVRRIQNLHHRHVHRERRES